MAARGPRLVTVSTDLGSAYAAQVRAALYRAAPRARVLELTHELPAHGIEESAFLLDHLLGGFPPRTVHLAVVDPGVGTSRAPIAWRARQGSLFVGPGNGLFDRLAARLGVARAVRLERHRFVPGARVGTTFDARDLFAPAAAHLALGRPITALGPDVEFRPVAAARPRRLPDGGAGRIVHIDRFGNAITDLPSGWFGPAGSRLGVRWGRRTAVARPLLRDYDAISPSGWGVLASSFGTLELACRRRSAALALRLRVGLPVVVRRLR